MGCPSHPKALASPPSSGCPPDVSPQLAPQDISAGRLSRAPRNLWSHSRTVGGALLSPAQKTITPSPGS
ncbi:g5273 [Coccomyxa elongata]